MLQNWFAVDDFPPFFFSCVFIYDFRKGIFLLENEVLQLKKKDDRKNGHNENKSRPSQ